MSLKRSFWKLFTLVFLTCTGLFVMGDGASKASGQTATVLVKAEPGETATQTSPQAVFPQIRYQFDAVLEGDRVAHSYKVLNKGGGELKIFEVNTG